MDPVQRMSPYVVLEENATYDSFVAQRRRYVEQLVDKWMWLIEGEKKQNLLPIPERQWEMMAILFENQMAVGQGLFSEETTKTDVALPVKFSLPIVRNVYPQLIATKIASVQPMPLSSGGVANVFYQDFLREDVDPETSLTQDDSDYAISEENAVPKRVKMEITKQTITATKDILGATWSTEVQEDARGALGINVESELVFQMSQEILREMDQRILGEILLWAGAGNVNWAWTMGSGYTTAKSWYETLGHALIDAEDLIYGYRYRSADFVIGGRNFVKYIRKMQDFKPEPRNQPPNIFKMGVELVGRIEGFWDVWLTPFINTNRAIMGYYPRTQTDTGYVYAPYIPLAPMPLVYASYSGPSESDAGAYKNTDKWSRNVRTRYGKKLVVPQAYSTLSIAAT